MEYLKNIKNLVNGCFKTGVIPNSDAYQSRQALTHHVINNWLIIFVGEDVARMQGSGKTEHFYVKVYSPSFPEGTKYVYLGKGRENYPLKVLKVIEPSKLRVMTRGGEQEITLY